MTFTLNLEPGATYDLLSRRLADIAGRLEEKESGEIRECGVVVGAWRIEK